jgi:ribonuclease P protein component
MRRGAEFSSTVRRGSRGTSGAVSVHLALDPAATAGATARVGFVVGRNVGPAVVRNQVRRRLRHLLRARLSSLPGAAAVVVRAHPAAAGLSSSALAPELDQALGRAASAAERRSRS